MEYLKHTDPDAFVDYDKKEPMPEYGKTKECPKCKGHGGWNLRLNAYPLHKNANTKENRHKMSHFKSSCNICNGYGYISEQASVCDHKLELVKNLGNCYNRYKCSICGEFVDVDSSD